MSAAGDVSKPVQQQTTAAHAAMLIFAVLVSTSFTVGAAITDTLDPAALTFLRFLLAACAFLLVLLLQGKWCRPSRGEALAAVVPAVSVSIFFISMFEALRLTSALNTGAIFALVPLMTALVAMPLLGERPNLRRWLALLLAAAGAIWVVFGGSLQEILAFRPGAGELVFLAGCIAYSAYSPALRRLDRGTPPLLMSFWITLAGLAALTLYAARTILTTDWLQVSLATYLGVLHLAIMTTAVSFMLIQYASLRLPQAKVMAYTYMVPAFILVTDGVVQNHWPTLSVTAGVAVIAIAMVVLQRD